MVHRSASHDAERDNAMQEDELKLVVFPAMADRKALAVKFGSSAWIPFYLYVLHLSLKHFTVLAHFRINHGADAREIHFHRRRVTFYHQELELWKQGKDVWEAARDESALVCSGRP